MDFNFVGANSTGYGAVSNDTMPDPVFENTAGAAAFDWSARQDFSGSPTVQVAPRNPSYDEAIAQVNRAEKKMEQLEVRCLDFLGSLHSVTFSLGRHDCQGYCKELSNTQSPIFLLHGDGLLAS